MQAAAAPQSKPASAATVVSIPQAIAVLTDHNVSHGQAVAAHLVLAAAAAGEEGRGAAEMVQAGCTELLAMRLLAEPTDTADQKDRKRCTYLSSRLHVHESRADGYGVVHQMISDS